MTYEQAIKVLGWDKPPRDFGPQTRQDIIDVAAELSANGTKAVDPDDAYRTRAEIEMYG
jgi:hypothetical protein